VGWPHGVREQPVRAGREIGGSTDSGPELKEISNTLKSQEVVPTNFGDRQL